MCLILVAKLKVIVHLEKHHTLINEEHNFQHSAKKSNAEKFHQVDNNGFDIGHILKTGFDCYYNRVLRSRSTYLPEHSGC